MLPKHNVPRAPVMVYSQGRKGGDMRITNWLATGIAFGLAAAGLATAEGFDERLFLQADENLGLVEGTIGPESFRRVNQFLNDHPEVQVLVLIDMPGSIDDETNLRLARLIRNLGIDTYVPENGQIASGAVDLFLAGNRRFAECGARIGVHSWADSDGATGDAIAREHPQHRLYLDYYAEMGIDADFYWFTLGAAPADDIYFMNPGEIARFGMVTEPQGC